MRSEGMEMEWSEFEKRVLQTLKGCQEGKDNPLIWAMEIGKWAVRVPSPELGEVLVSHLCFHNNHPSLWKFLHQALSSTLLFPLHVLSLLTARVIPRRLSQPEAYRIYLELVTRYAFAFDPIPADASKDKIVKDVDHALHLSQIYEVRVRDLGHAWVLFFFSVIVRLIDSTLNDWGLLITSLDRPRLEFGSADHHDEDTDSKESHNSERNENRKQLQRMNSLMAMEVLGKLTESRKAMVLLRLVRLNMPEKFNGLLQRVQFLKAHQLASSDLKPRIQLLAKFLANIQRVLGFEYRLNRHKLIGMLINVGSHKPVSHCDSESGKSACWIPLDIYMENAMDGKQLPIKSATDVLAEAIISLQVLNQASWQETFLALWLSALRLVQRERDPLEGPIPHLEARLSVLLSIVPLAISKVLEDETKLYTSPCKTTTMSGSEETRYGHDVDGKPHTSRKQGLICSLQVIGQFSSLLCPPASVVGAANSAAAKAAGFILNSKNAGLGGGSHVGNMRHLILEACIARNLIDTSAYFWPGYVSVSAVSPSETSVIEKSPWSIFMEGERLSGSLIDSLFTTSASSLVEIEKIYHIALNGSEEEKSAAAKILCGASLRRGWNIQEHVVSFVVKLLSPPVPSDYIGPRSHLIDYMPMLSAILFGASSIDTVHILSLHGMVPEVAASLMPLCEVFGSLKPTSSNKSSMEDNPSVHMVFSLAFLLLIRLWKFYRPPLEQCMMEHGGAAGGELTLEYLLFLRNSRIASSQHEKNSISAQIEYASDMPIYIDSYPKLQAWYCQNKSCISSTFSSISRGNPVHQVANEILNMLYWKVTKTGSEFTGEEAYQKPLLPAWEVLEAIPYVLEAILSACAHGRLSPRDLTTGLRDLVDFLPASLVAIISYFSAEVTRGIWKPVPMNGSDWPSPAAILQSVESEIKEILADVGVNALRCSSEISPILLPLPMAVLVSLTITFKLDKSLEYIHAVAGPALENCASGCPWPSMPIIGSLWAQKVSRWHDFIVVSCSRSVFRQDKEAVAQLIGSCFTSFLGSLHVTSLSLSNQSSVNGLLGFTIPSCSIRPSVAPGFLYLRSCRAIQNVQYVNDVIVGRVAGYAKELGTRWVSMNSPCLKSSETSLCVAASKAREVATLGASLLCVTGGVQLVQELYRETIPTWLLSAKQDTLGEVDAISHVLEGYAMAYLLILSGSIVWGVGAKLPSSASSRRPRIVGIHMDFLARVLEGNISLGCNPATWKAYVSCLMGLMVNFTPTWIEQVKLESLRNLASGLRGWHECELALSLLERGGAAAIGSVAELVTAIS
ncbi:mediator of RNA polymerase II transcription subunit 33A [Ziziphus jujuba]|uniref:Mediator of RNA polymerase II transcription subunit 33A n=1 Tax=Ziziphus jujuba TaxID=326968 RepID=A0A6P4B6L6_ZIZJJ|nr:mediator of RNA polymerase II transcription subunit 33A [Ziziphus jujuba]